MKRLLLILLLFSPPVLAQNAGSFNGQLSSSGSGQLMTLVGSNTYLSNTFTGKPVFIVGEDAFSLSNQLSNADVLTYLTDRASRGFNAIWITAPDNIYQTNTPDNYYGVVPFSGADFTNEVTAFWVHVDNVVRQSQALGITVWLSPGFVGLNSSSGYLTSYVNSSSTVLTNYGTWLGTRYAAYPNIVWALGGDWDPSTLAASQLNYLAAGIHGADPNHLITIEACRACSPANQSTMDAWSQATAMNLNWVYAPYSGMQASCASNYARSGALPALAGEDWYEGEHSMTALQLREEPYWETLSGCTLGRFFGNNPMWCFDSAQTAAGCNTGTTWQSQLSSAGSTAEQYHGQLMRSREFWKMAPDTSNAVLTGGIGSGTSISVASCTSDGQTCIVYDPIGNSQAPQIAMSHFSGTVHAWWFNPASAATTDLSTFTTSGTHTFTPADGNDWVLVLDLNSAGLAAPGTTTE
jgi:hypothetical protein